MGKKTHPELQLTSVRYKSTHGSEVLLSVLAVQALRDDAGFRKTKKIKNWRFGCVFLPTDYTDGHKFFLRQIFSDCTDCWSLGGSCHAGCFVHQSSPLATTIIRAIRENLQLDEVKSVWEKRMTRQNICVHLCNLWGEKTLPKVKWFKFMDTIILIMVSRWTKIVYMMRQAAFFSDNNYQ